MSERGFCLLLLIGGMLTLLIGWYDESKAAIAAGAMMYGLGVGAAIALPVVDESERAK